MSKKLSIIVFCFIVGIFFSALSYSQEDPATTADKDTTVTDKSGDTKQETVVSPDAKVYLLNGNIFVNNKVQYKLQAKDNVLLDKIMYRIDGGEYQVYSAPFAIEAEGQHVISYYGVDKIGNQEADKLFRIIVDNTAPDINVISNTPIISANGKYYISKNYNFSIESYDALSGVNKVDYSVNGEAKEYVNPFSIAAEGEVELKVSSVDNVNNKAEQFALSVLTDKGKAETIRGALTKLAVDNAAPVVTITPSEELKKAENDKNIAANTVKYDVTATDADSGIAAILVRVDNTGDFAPYINQIKFKTNGEHFIEAKAIDRVGNVSELKSLSVFVDVIAPESQINTMPE